MPWRKPIFTICLAILFPGLCIKSPEICIELTDRHVFQLRLDVFLFAPCYQLQENKVINRFIVKTKLVLETKLVSVIKDKIGLRNPIVFVHCLSYQVATFRLFIFNNVRKNNYLNLKLTLERRNTPVSVFLGLV